LAVWKGSGPGVRKLDGLEPCITPPMSVEATKKGRSMS